ncbi:hypothetical protein Maes01_01400 [Microbulbifer aestuariivivens]|uniref:HD domain-containing protein n=1 Tax=Microbulbifer aestuariivivens TaxID=1908308 RepID=A0ABP9WQY3_9GAMM
MQIETDIPLLEELLAPWRQTIGDQYLGYRNHVYRMVHCCLALADRNAGCTDEERQKILIAGAFHDIGIWIEDTVDYIEPSLPPAMAYLQENGRAEWCDEIRLMLTEHHKLRPYRGDYARLVELFRRGDLVDFSCGLVSFGLDKRQLKALRAAFPNAGFHRDLGVRAWQWFLKHPLNPAPMMKW